LSFEAEIEQEATMGLLDQILGGKAGQKGGMSPMMMLLLGVLAYRAYKNHGGGAVPAGVPQPRGAGPAGPVESPGGGGLSDLLRGSLGGLLGGAAGGAAAGTLLNGGLRDLIDRFQQSGHGDIADSWVGTGPNRSVTPDQLRDALGSDNVDTLAREAGIDQIGLLNDLSQDLPDTVDQLTPDGRFPEEGESSRA
jgi:uncharacterized protein YidB (DUF937 family)